MASNVLNVLMGTTQVGISITSNVELYNSMSVCVEYGIYCDLVSGFYVTEENLEWARVLNK